MSTLTCMDLFAGCGGLTLGLQNAGFEVRWANELDPHAAETYRTAHPSGRMFEEDAAVLLKRLLDGDRRVPGSGDVDLLAGGPPCQGFSGYNRHRRPDDPRNSLVELFFDFVAELQPRYVLMENVPGMLSLDNGRVPLSVLAAMESLGYAARLGVLQAGHYGLPQNRWRVFIVAARSGSALPSLPQPRFVFPRTTIFGATRFRHCVVKPPGAAEGLFWRLRPTVTVADAIADLPGLENGGGGDEAHYTIDAQSPYQRRLRSDSTLLLDHRCPRMGELMLERCRNVPKRPGAGWLDLPEHLKPRNLLRHGDKRYDNRFGRLHWDGTFNTILTKPEPYWGAVFHPEQDRIISIREAARAQALPDYVRLSGPTSCRYQQVGNVVPPPVSTALGREILKAAGVLPGGDDDEWDA